LTEKRRFSFGHLGEEYLYPNLRFDFVFSFFSDEKG
jgi:hypothetical protein